MKQLTRKQAIEFYESGKWKDMTPRERAEFQIMQDKLCMPFSEFHEAIEKTLGRPVYTREFGLNRDGLRAELLDGAKAPSLDEIVGMIPGPNVVVVTEAGEAGNDRE